MLARPARQGGVLRGRGRNDSGQPEPDQGKAVLLRLCENIEAGVPTDLAALYALPQAATEEFNDLEAEFEAASSEIETIARDFWFIARAYGFTDADAEELIATREW
ncbi:hypothetical protein K6I34_000956 [Streptomyces sp. UNOC14_S4]|nr:hypothetical protein [Streptomyces sp. UNOC14_S4]